MSQLNCGIRVVSRVRRSSHGRAVTAAAAETPGYERLQVLAADGVLQLGDGFGFDLPHALAGDLEDAADFFQRVGVAVAQAVTQADDLPLAVGERLEQLFDLARAAGRCWPACAGLSVPWSSMNSPKLLSSLSPIGRSRLTGWRPMSSTRRLLRS